MMNDRFRRRLTEALALATGSGAPPAAPPSPHDGMGEEPFEPTAQQLQAVYQWCLNNGRLLLPPAVAALERSDPSIHVSNCRVTSPAGRGSNVAVGEAALEADWHLREPDLIGYLQQLRQLLLRSDLPKAVGVRYEDFHRVLDSPPVLEAIVRGTQYLLNGDQHSAFWLHELKAGQLDRVRASITAWLAHHPLVRGAKRGEYRVADLRVTQVGKPRNRLAADYQAPQHMQYRHPASTEPLRFSTSLELRTAAALRFGFHATTDALGRPGEGAFLELDRSLQGDIVGALHDLLEPAWERHIAPVIEISANLRPNGEAEPEAEPETFRVELPAEELHRVLGDFYGVTPPPPGLAAAVCSMPPEVLRLVEYDAPCDRQVRGLDAEGWTATLRLEQARLDESQLQLVIRVVDIEY